MKIKNKNRITQNLKKNNDSSRIFRNYYAEISLHF